ncbi:hypothetical protein MNEG_3274 [Monoraphidium neglectum]|uniref:Uncharacterized protein n=1 Tax=Monoraphidium neglectum TaxID=145388 RepID=A0A0D2MW43_9CHLO|nr:hypothetical protein MNEG_3274 [Monoraphidium neglectum]KIZ04687.1 hypothetical protein MNEG_3274 [Monoraphidium neglectum]|eukprot:XP_013903706.1 hypothetical protein MNEG_3274 [Monoraphidium neglectum]
MAAVDEVLAALEQAPQGDEDAKIEALKGLTALIDPADESYEVQRSAAGRVLHVLMQLLEDDSQAVVVEAANSLAALSDHAGVVKDRLEAGHFAATAEKVALNPVQEEVGELEGIFGVLVNLRFSESEPVAVAGTEALAALTSLNRANTITLLHEVVHRLGQGEARALGALDDLVVGIDIRDDVAVLLDQALSPALGFLRTGSPADKAAAAALLGNIAEGRRGAATYLVAEGALPLAAELLDDRKLLSPAKAALGVSGKQLVEPLLDLVEQSEGHAQAEAEGEGEEEPEGDINVVENGDSALLLLRALAAQDPDVTQALKGEGGLLTTRSCAIM